MKLFSRIARSRAFQFGTGVVCAEFLRLVWNTNRLTILPSDLYETVRPHFPIIITMWHGQHFMMPFVRRSEPEHQTKVLISRHRDGEINAIAAERLGIGTIRGSGDTGGRFDLKGGVGAFKAMLDTLKAGCNVALTADVPKIARVAGLGVTKLAARSGRPIYAFGIATSRRHVIDNWDRSVVNLPFGRIAIAAEGPIYVPDTDDPELIEKSRLEIERRLNIATERAYAMVDGRESA
ncbi:MAG: lysophospholipid acyltransferase family protein [Xanthobacteraceae bacterium]